MKIPSCFYGTRLEAKKECNKVARKLWKGEPLVKAVAGYEMIDTKEVPVNTGEDANEGCLVVGHPLCMEPKMKHFYMNWVVRTLYDKFYLNTYDEENMERIFNQLIEYEWGILGLSEDTGLFNIGRADRRHRWQPYLRKLCEYWDIFCAEGKRYIGGANCTGLWNASYSLWGVLRDMGVPKEESVYVSDTADLRKLCDKYNLLTMDVYNDPRIPEEYRLKD